MEIEEHLNRADSEAIRFDGFNTAIIGRDNHAFLVYDFEKMMDCLMDDNSSDKSYTEADAIDWLDYNVLSINGGNRFTVVFT